MGTRSCFLLALVCTCLGAGNADEARKCLPGDKAPSCKGRDTDTDVLLQSRVTTDDVEEDGAAAEDKDQDEDEDEDEDEVDEEEHLRLAEADEVDEELYILNSEEDEEIMGEAAETEDTVDEVEDTADEVEDASEEERGGKGRRGGGKKPKPPKFKDIWKQIRRGVRGLDFLNCNSFNNCVSRYFNLAKDAVMRGVSKLTGHLTRGALGPARSFVTGTLFKQFGRSWDQAKRTANSIKNDFSKAAQGLMRAARSERLDMCTPHGMGIWNFAATDCGAFSEVRNIMKLKWNKLHKVGKYMNRAISKFGQCMKKTHFGIMWTPFMNVVVRRWCVPNAIKRPLEGFIGSIKFVVSQLNGNGRCSGVFCTIMKGAKMISEKFQQVFKEVWSVVQRAALLEEGAEGTGLIESDENNAALGRPVGHCGSGTTDFALFITPGVGFKWPGGNTVGAGLTLRIGCNKKRYFNDISLDLGGTYYVAGPKVELDGREFGGGITLGFSVGRIKRAVVTWKAEITYNGKLACVGCTTDAKVGISFKVLPFPGTPKGFSVKPEATEDGKPNALLQRQQEINDAVAQQETDEDMITAGVAKTMEAFQEVELTNAIPSFLESDELMSQVRAAANKTDDVSPPWPYIKEVTINAGLAIKLCLTCIGNNRWYAN